VLRDRIPTEPRQAFGLRRPVNRPPTKIS